MDKHVPRSVARVIHLDVLNRLLSPDEIEVKPEAFFAGMETVLEKQAKDLADLQTNPLKLLSFTMQRMRGEESKTQPEVERIPCLFYEDGLSHVESMLRMRQHLAMRHWNGEAELTMMDIITEEVAKMTGTSPQTPAKPMPQRTRIDWDFDPEIPTRDFFDCRDLTQQYEVAEALKDFLRKVKRDQFRLWEAIIRDEQNLPTVPAGASSG